MIGCVIGKASGQREAARRRVLGGSKLHANLRPREGSAPSAPTLFGGQRRVCCACASCGHGEASMRGAAWHHATHSASWGDGLRFSVSGTEGALYTPRHKASRRPSKTVSRSYFFFFQRRGRKFREMCKFPKVTQLVAENRSHTVSSNAPCNPRSVENQRGQLA